MNNWRVNGWFRPPPLPWPILSSASVAPNRYQFCHRLNLSSLRPKGLSRERVVPLRPPVPQPPPTPADELERCHHIVAAADRLADLSTRLEQFARPPPASDIREFAAAAGRSW